MFIKRFRKILIWFFSVIIIIPLILVLLIQLPSVQTKLTSFFANKISQKLHTTVSVKSVDISFFSSLILNGVYVEDLNRDTLVYIDKLDANIADFSIKQNYVKLKELSFNNVALNIKIDSINKTNFQFIIDSLISNKPDTSKTNWKLFCSNFNISNSKFSFKNKNIVPVDYGINFNDLLVNNLNLKLSDLETFKDSLALKISGLSAKEKSGFLIKNFNANLILSNKNIRLDNLDLALKNSEIKASNFSFKYKSFDDFNNFISKVKLETNLDSSKINFSDIAYFAPSLKNVNQAVFVSGKIKGKIDNLKSKDLKFYIGSKTFLNAKINITGLPDINETFFYADIKKITTKQSDLDEILKNVIPNNKIEFPKNINKLGTITYVGNFTGFINDFVAYGNFNTKIGNFSTDILFKNDTLTKTSKFNGKIAAIDFNLGKLTSQDSIIGNVNLKLKVDASINKNNSLKGYLEGNISSIEINNYNYKNVKIDGDIVDKMFDGHLNFNDSNIVMDFLGRFDFNEQIPIFDFTADIGKIRLDKINLNYINADTNSTLSMLLTAKVKGYNINNIDGSIDVFSLKYKTANKLYAANKIQIRTDKQDVGKKITINSDFVDATISGEYNFITIKNSFDKIANHFIPNLFEKSNNQKTDTNNFDFNITFHKTKELFDVLLPNYFLSENSSIKGEINDVNNKIMLDCKFDTLMLDKNVFYNTQFKTKTEQDSMLYTKFSAKESKIENTLDLNNLNIKTITNSRRTNFELSWLNKDSLEYSGEIYASLKLIKTKNKPIVNIDFLPSSVVIADSLWYVSDSKIIIDTTSLNIKNFIFNKDNQYIYANGKISELTTDSLKIDFNDVDLKNLNFFLKKYNFNLNGKLNGFSYLNDFYKNYNLVSDIGIKDLTVNNEKIGDSRIINKWDNEQQKFILSAYSLRGKLKTINLYGNIFPKTQKIDLTLSLNKLRLNTFNPLLDGVASQLNGIASGDIKINGNFKTPITEGRLKLQKTSFKIDYLNTVYNFTDYIDISANKINFNKINMYDEKGNIAIMSGEIDHKFFTDFKLNVTIQANKFKVLDTQEKDNNLFYGKAFSTGTFNIHGTPSNIIFDINATTDKNTKFYIPITSAASTEDEKFIRFTNSNIDNDVEQYKVDLSGIELNFDLNVTPDAEIQIIFDKQVGDIIKSVGSGNINLKIDTKGKFNINGEYKIDKGDYLFTLQNIINKHFDIEKESTIKFNGDPYNASINIDAIYRTKTSLYNLTLDSLDKSKMPVNCRLLMTNSLLDPKINFKIDVPNSSDRVEAILNSFNEDQINKQMLSLLVINSFYTPENLRGTGVASTKSSNAFGVNSSELLSNQLSHWLSQISNDFDIGVNYRPGDEISTDELEVALSTQILNDRVTINGNFGVGGTSQNTDNSSSLAGNVDVNVKINKSGSLQMKGYTKSNNDEVYTNSPTTQGVGIFYSENFDTFNELITKYWRKIFKKKENQE